MDATTQAALAHDFNANARQLEIDGSTLNFIELGEPGKPALLYVHGLMGTWRNWIFNLLPFADRYRVIAVDLPGFGDSQMPRGEFSIEHYADVLRELLGKLGIERVTLIGNSMGGQIGTVVAKKMPEILDQLVLVDPAGFSTSSKFLRKLAPWAKVLDFFFAIGAKFKRTIAFNRWLAAAATKIVLHKPMEISGNLMMLLVEGLGKAGFVPAVLTITRTPVRFFPGEVKTPTTIIWGRNDLLIPKKDAFKFHKMIPGSRLELMDDVGHIPMFETPERFNALIESVLAEAPKAQREQAAA